MRVKRTQKLGFLDHSSAGSFSWMHSMSTAVASGDSTHTRTHDHDHDHGSKDRRALAVVVVGLQPLDRVRTPMARLQLAPPVRWYSVACDELSMHIGQFAKSISSCLFPPADMHAEGCFLLPLRPLYFVVALNSPVE